MLLLLLPLLLLLLLLLLVSGGVLVALGHVAQDGLVEFPYKLSCNFSPRATRYAHAIASGNIIAAAAVAWLSYFGAWVWRTEAMLLIAHPLPGRDETLATCVAFSAVTSPRLRAASGKSFQGTLLAKQRRTP